MGTVRRVVISLTVPLVAAPSLLPAARVSAADTVHTGRAAQVAQAAAAGRHLPADPGSPIGGPQLAGRGLVVDRVAGIPKLPKVPASSFVIADGDTGQVLAARDPHGHYLPASALKVLTAIALIPRLQADALVRPTQRTCDVEGTKVGMTPKLRYKVSDLFKALMMVSGNDAALALTQANGGMPRTLAAMNAEAKRLRAGDTRAGSPNGLDVDLGLSIKTQHTSSYDLALMMRQGLKLPDFTEYVGTVDARWPAPPTKAQRKKGKKLGGYPIYTHNKLVRPGPSQYKGMIGGKNGYTNAARQTFVGAARRNGRTIIVSLMHSSVPFWPYVPKMLDWGFAASGKVKPAGTLVDPVPAERAEKKEPRGTAEKVADNISPNGSAQWRLVTVALAAFVALGAGVMIGLRRRRSSNAVAAGPGPHPAPGAAPHTLPGPPPGSPPGQGPSPGTDHDDRHG